MSIENKPIINVASCANEKFSLGLNMSIVSCFARASGKYNYCFTVIDGGLSEENKKELSSLLDKVSEKVRATYTLVFHKPNREVTDELPQRVGTWMAYARLLLPRYIVDSEYVVYVDADVLCMRGVEDFVDAWDDSAAMVAVRDPLEYLIKDWPVNEELNPKNAPYYNSGLVLLNLNWMRSALSMEQLHHIIEKFDSKKFLYADQTVINYAAKGKIIEIERVNNWVLAVEYAAQTASVWDDANMHFVGRVKPWMTKECVPSRYIAEMLFYHACLAYGLSGVKERKVNPAVIRKHQWKAFFYSLVKPKRAETYKKILKYSDEWSVIEGKLNDEVWYG